MHQPLKIYFMSLLIFLAGLIHLTSPEKFMPALPLFVPYPLSVIYITGLFEIILAIMLLKNKTQDIAAKTLAFYFLILLPIHVYVSINGIEMFGVSNKLFLWMRTGFQFVLYFWALSIQKESWVIEQVWRDVFFIHYQVSPDKLKKLVPFELDLYDNKAVLSIVPFYMDAIRFPFLPRIPKLSSLWELNLRTYVNVNGVKGIYFFTLETDSKIGELIARYFFHLPYRYSKITAEVGSDHYKFEHSRESLNFLLDANLNDKIKNSDFDLWATERYSLFTYKNGISYQGVVKHLPWKLKVASITKINNKFTEMVIPDVGEIKEVSYSKEIKVSFQNFKKL